MYINEVCKRFDVVLGNQFTYTKDNFKWLIDLTDRSDLSMVHFHDADQWCVTNLPDEDFVIGPRRFFFRFLTDATLFRLQFS
jgi:hypothetical protein